MIRWLLVIGYFVAIFLFSGQNQSGASAMYQWFREWLPSLSGADIQTIVFYVRKSGHVIAYGLATILTYYAAKITPWLKRSPLLFTLILVFSLAGIDEWYQTMLPHRSGVWQDVLIDGIGISVSIICLSLYERLILRKKLKNSHIKENDNG